MIPGGKLLKNLKQKETPLVKLLQISIIHLQVMCMKKIHLKPWLLYAIIFVLLMVVNGTRWRLFPGDDPEGGNLLVNAVLALMGTAVFALIYTLWRTYRRTRKSK